jgi:voltage-gated potassium channel
MTTVGYGDLSPQTNAGRVLAMFVMVVGIGFIALVTGAIAQRFLAGEVEEIEEGVAEEVEATEAILRELRAVSAVRLAPTPNGVRANRVSRV